MSSFKKLCADLESMIIGSYEMGVTLDEAEKLAGRFLQAQIQVSDELKKADLDSRMRKAGLKAIKAAVYMSAATTPEKKPTEAALAAIVDCDSSVVDAQNELDSAEVERDSLERYYNIFREAHIYYRGISKGKFE